MRSIRIPLVVGFMGLSTLLLAGCCCARVATPAAAPLASQTADVPEGRQVFIDVTTVRVPVERALALLGDRVPKSANESTPLSAEEAKLLLAALRDDPGTRVLHAPKMLALEGQFATIFIGETVRFAKTKATVNEHGGLEFSISEAPSSPVSLGYHLRCVATPDEAGARIALALHIVDRQQKASLSGEQVARMGAVRFLRDGIYEQTFDAAIEIDNDGYVLLGSPEPDEDGDGRHLRVSVLHAAIVSSP